MVFLTCHSHRRVNSGHHLAGIAPRVVATEQVAAQPFAHKRLRRAKHLRLGPAKPVDALLGVADDEHAERLRTAATSSVAAEP